MKPLDQLNNIERAKLLHELFPYQINGFIAYVEQTAKVITSTPEKVKDQWGSKTISAEVWIELAIEIQQILAKERTNLIAFSEHFAGQLFPGYKGIFLMQCMQEYISICPNSKFNKAIDLLFDV